MPVTKLIAVKEFCNHHRIDQELILAFESRKLIALVKEKRSYYIPRPELPLAEKLVRLYNHLGINLEGLEVVLPLLERIEKRDRELTELRRRLSFYEKQ
jgi:hypothetical protein